MTNREKLKNLSDLEFAEYIYSVFIAGKLAEKLKGSDEPYSDYVKWLQKEEDNE